MIILVLRCSRRWAGRVERDWVLRERGLWNPSRLIRVISRIKRRVWVMLRTVLKNSERERATLTIGLGKGSISADKDNVFLPLFIYLTHGLFYCENLFKNLVFTFTPRLNYPIPYIRPYYQISYLTCGLSAHINVYRIISRQLFSHLSPIHISQHLSLISQIQYLSFVL